MQLERHPRSEGAEEFRVEAAAERGGDGTLSLRYVVTGPVDRLRVPAPAAPMRTDELWRHTCFEVFVRAGEGEAYYEFNFAPSTQWAAYRFEGYRTAMAAAEAGAPAIRVRPQEGLYELSATAVLDRLSDLPHDAPWRLALSAVLEGTDGRRSYWALAHPSGAPDFHHPDSFTLSLAPTPR